MLVRILSALVGIPLAASLIFADGGNPFAIAVGIAAAIGFIEYYRGIKKAGAEPHIIPGIIACVTMVAWANDKQAESPIGVYSAILVGLFLLMLVLELIRQPSEPVKNIGATVLGVAYVGGLFAHMVLLRGFQGEAAVKFLDTAVDKAALLVMFVFLSTWACDTFAYFIGRKWGKKKLIPRISPGKSVEGSIAGFAGSTVVAMLAGTAIHIPIVHSLILGAAIGILCQVGDFVESAMKREIGIKDFGAILPGHGGVLDRFDSLLFTSTATYYYAYFLLGGWLS